MENMKIISMIVAVILSTGILFGISKLIRTINKFIDRIVDIIRKDKNL